MNCPRCETVLQTQTIKELHQTIEVDSCLNCGGTWLDKDEISPLESVIEPVLLERRKIDSQIDQLIGLYCPSCSDHPLMEKTTHRRDTKVIIDYCATCEGIWLDKGEIQAIQQENWWTSIFNLFS